MNYASDTFRGCCLETAGPMRFGDRVESSAVVAAAESLASVLREGDPANTEPAEWVQLGAVLCMYYWSPKAMDETVAITTLLNQASMPIDITNENPGDVLDCVQSRFFASFRAYISQLLAHHAATESFMEVAHTAGSEVDLDHASLDFSSNSPGQRRLFSASPSLEPEEEAEVERFRHRLRMSNIMARRMIIPRETTLPN